MAGRAIPRLAYLLATIVIVSCASPARAQTRQAPVQQLDWTKIDCADAHLLAPAGMEANCFEAGFEKAQGNYDCSLNNVSVGSPADGSEPHFFARARYPRVGSQSCVTMGFPNAGDALQHFHPFLAQATNWSALETPRSDLQLRFFDSGTQARDGRCFSFIKNGPAQTRQGIHVHDVRLLLHTAASSGRRGRGDQPDRRTPTQDLTRLGAARVAVGRCSASRAHPPQFGHIPSAQAWA